MDNCKERKSLIVISGINLFEGGPLSVYYDFLEAIVSCDVWRDNRIVAFVHKKELFEKYKEYVDLIELPLSRKNYLCRLYYEYVYFKRYSKRESISVWISLHDITPSVKSDTLYTYCHNASPFLKKSLKNLKYSWKVVAFSYFYKYLYRINIKKATGIIVQQDWMRQEFVKLYGISNVIVANPTIKIDDTFVDSSNPEKNIFIYASLPRFFKNFEVILEASKMLEDKGVMNYEVWITIDGTENKYARDIKAKYNDLKNIKWLGRIPRNELFELYNQSNYMIFPSKLESWGLPISEYKMTGKPIILADLPYSHEALGDYDNAAYFDPEDANGLFTIMNNAIQKKEVFKPSFSCEIAKPYCANWNELIHYLFENNSVDEN